MNRFELNKALKVKLNEFDKTINPFERNDVLFINESEYPEFLEVTTEEVTHENNKDPYKTITISDKKDRFIAKNKITRNSNSYYLSSNFNDSSSLLISHNIYSLGNKIMNEVSASVNNHLIGQTIEISYNISTGDLTSFVIENIMKFIVNMTSEYKRVYELGSRYPDNALALLSKAFSYAKFDNSEFVTFKHIYKAIMNCQSVYSDVVKKEAEAFKVKFKDFLEKENVDLNDY